MASGRIVNVGASHGITLAGLDKNPDTTAAVPTGGIFTDSTIINSGRIIGQTRSAIAVTGAGNSQTVAINNRVGGLIECSSASAPAIFTSANNTRVTDYGTITADASRRAPSIWSAATPSFGFAAAKRGSTALYQVAMGKAR